MSFPFIWRRTAEADLAAWKERAELYRQQAAHALKVARREVTNRRTIAELYADLCDSHGLPVPVDTDQPDRRQAKKAMAAFDEAQAKRAATRIARLQKAVARGRAEAAATSRRAESLQAQLDDALGLNSAKVTAGTSWQDRRETRMQYDPPTTKTSAKEAS